MTSMTRFYYIIFIITLCISMHLCYVIQSYSRLSALTLPHISRSALYFKKSSGGDNANGPKRSIFDGLLRFVSSVTRSRVKQEYEVLPSTGDRYHLRLKRPDYEGKTFLT